jgi:tetratricopeptide (TPR) repeat protein
MAAARDWIRWSTPHFDLLSNAGEKPGRAVLLRLEQARAVVKWGRAPSRPVRVFLFRTETEFAQFRREAFVKGMYQGSGEGDIILLFQDPEVERAAVHEYVHLKVYRSGIRLPKWAEEGWAEYHSTFRMRGGEAEVGWPVEAHVALLRQVGLLRAGEMARPVDGADGAWVARYYAQAWAMVHLLESQAPETWREKAREASVDSLIALLPQHLAQPFRVVRIPVTVEMAEAAARPVEAVEMARHLADLALDCGKKELAARFLKQAMPGEPGPVIAGLLALAEGRMADARRLLTLAIEQGSRDSRVHFEYAMLLREAGDREAESRALRSTLELNPEHPEALFLAGVRATDEGRLEEAVALLRRATAVLPRHSSLWHALAMAYFRQKRMDEMRAAAEQCFLMAASMEEIDQARALRGLLEKRETETVKRLAVVTPESWSNPRGDRFVEGQLVDFVCAEPPRITVENASGQLTLTIREPGRVPITGADGVRATFACGPQKGPRVRVEFDEATRAVTAIQLP